MKKLFVLASLLSSTAFGFTYTPKKNMGKPNNVIELVEENTVSVRGEVDEAMVSKFIKDVESVKGDEVFVYISSPGGSVISGMKMISYVRATPKKIICISDVSISMAFVFLQACDERISNSNTIAMQHVTSYGIRPQQAPNAVSFQKFLERMAEKMDITQAKRVGLSYEAFKAKTRSDWWLFGEDVVAQGVTDHGASITCSKKLIETTKEEKMQGPYGIAVVTFSACPIVSTPLNVELKKVAGTPEQVAEFIAKLDVRQNIIDKLEKGDK